MIEEEVKAVLEHTVESWYKKNKIPPELGNNFIFIDDWKNKYDRLEAVKNDHLSSMCQMLKAWGLNLSP